MSIRMAGKHRSLAQRGAEKGWELDTLGNLCLKEKERAPKPF